MSTGHEQPKRAVAYVRVSTDKQATEGLSLGEQQKRVEAYIAAEGWDHVETYIEAGESGRRDDRPQLKRMLAATDRYDALVIPKLDRLGRSTIHLLDTVKQLEAAGVQLVSLKDHLDTSTPTGRLLLRVLASVAEFESDMIGERVASVSQARVDQGFAHGRPPFGYRAQGKGKMMKVHEAEANVVREIFKRYIKGESQRAIARNLNQRGVKAQRGEWTQGSIARLLSNPMFVGRIRLKGEEYDGGHEPIISEETWSKSQAVSAANARSHRGRSPAANHLLSAGMLVCTCGESMWALTQADKRYGTVRETYQCSRRQRYGTDACNQKPISRELVDEAVWRFFEQVGLDAEATKQLMSDESNGDVRARQAELAQAQRAEETYKRRLKNVREDYQERRIPVADWNAQRPDLEADLAAATARVDRLAAEVSAAQEHARAVDSQVAALVQLTRSELIEQVRSDAGRSTDALRGTLRRLFSAFELLTPEHPFGARREGDDGTVWQGSDPLRVVDGYMLQPRVRSESISLNVETGDGFPGFDRAPLPLPGSDSKRFGR